jgi:hypothetical protein
VGGKNPQILKPSRSQILRSTGNESQALGDAKPKMSHQPGECNNELLNSYLPVGYLQSNRPEDPSEEMRLFCPNVKGSCCSDYQLRYLMHRYMSGKLLLLKIKISLEDLFAVFTTIDKSQITSLYELNGFCFKEKSFSELDKKIIALKSANIKNITDEFFKKKLNFFKGFLCSMCSERQSVYFNILKKYNNEIQSEATISGEMCYDFISEHNLYLKIKQLIGKMRVILGSIECAVKNMDFSQEDELRKIFFKSTGRVLRSHNSESSLEGDFATISLGRGANQRLRKNKEINSEFTLKSMYNKTLSDWKVNHKSFVTHTQSDPHFINVSLVSKGEHSTLKDMKKDVDVDVMKLEIPEKKKKRKESLLLENHSDSENLFFNDDTTRRIKEKIKRIEMQKKRNQSSKSSSYKSLSNASHEERSSNSSKNDIAERSKKFNPKFKRKFQEDQMFVPSNVGTNTQLDTTNFYTKDFVAPDAETEEEESSSYLSEESYDMTFVSKRKIVDKEKEQKMKFIAKMMNKKLDSQTKRAISNLETRDQIKKFLKACILLREKSRDNFQFEEKILEANCTSFCRKNVNFTKLRLSKTFLKEIAESYDIISRILGNSADEIERNKSRNHFVLKRIFRGGSSKKSFESLKEDFMSLGVDFMKVGLTSSKGKVIQFFNYNKKGVYDFDKFFLINVRNDMGVNLYRLDFGNFGLFEGTSLLGLTQLLFLTALLWSSLN